MAEKYAFISYSSENQQQADSVRTLFIKNSIPCWMAPYDVPAGSKYAHVINDALENCTCIVLLLTNAAQKSQFVDRELERAVSYNKPIITIQLEDVQLNSGFKFYLGNSHIVAVRKIQENSSQFRKVMDSVCAFVGIEKCPINTNRVSAEPKAGAPTNSTRASQKENNTDQRSTAPSIKETVKTSANRGDITNNSAPSKRGVFQRIIPLISAISATDSPLTFDRMVKLAKGDKSGKAKYDLAMAYYEGKLCPQDYEKAFILFSDAALLSYSPAYTAMGNCYIHGHGIRKDPVKAAHYYMLAREAGEAEGAFLLGQCYEEGTGVPVNYKVAAECYAQAAEKNHVLAQRHLAFCYDSNGRGVKHDAKMAFTLYQKAAEAGDPKSMLKMADYYGYGQFVKKDPEKRDEWINRAIELGDTEAIYNLARSTEPSLQYSREACYPVYEIEERCIKAIELYKQAAEQGYQPAIDSLEWLHKELLEEQHQSNPHYQMMAIRLLDAYWPKD